MGQSAEVPVTPGQCFRIATGGMLPPGADAIAMIEHTQVLDTQTIEVFRSVSPGDHLIRVGEDLKRGQPIFPQTRRLQPQDLGLLAGVGIREVSVFRKPRVAIISTGDEIVPIDQEPLPGFVRDINAYTLPALVEKAGGDPPFSRADPGLPGRPERKMPGGPGTGGRGSGLGGEFGGYP